MQPLADRASAEFSTAFGSRPAVVAVAPGRVNLLGAHTDHHQGLVLTFATDQATALAVRPRDDDEVRLVSDLTPGMIHTDVDSVQDPDRTRWAARPLEVIAALARRHRLELPGLDLAFVSDIPVNVGLGASAALETATAVALDGLLGLHLPAKELARVGQLAEDRVVGAPSGIKDQTTALLGRSGSAVLLDCLTGEAEIVPLGLHEAGLATLVIDMAVAHSAAPGRFAIRRTEALQAAQDLGVGSLRSLGTGDLKRAEAELDDAGYRRVRHVVTENERVRLAVELLKEGRTEAIGPILTASYVSQRDDFDVSTVELDLAVESALAAGAVGARPMAGTLGGSIVALVPIGLLPRVGRTVDRAFARTAHKAPRVFRVAPSDGAYLTREVGANA